MKEMIELLRKEFPELKIRTCVPYAELTTLGVGSTLPFLAEIADEKELAAFLTFTFRNRIPLFIIGGGTNLAGMDAPCPKLGVRLSREGFSGTEKKEGKLRAGARLRLPDLARRAAEAGFGGLAPLSGIPGTLGGALRMNAGASGASIGQFVAEVAGFRLDGTPYREDGGGIKWSYRESSIPEEVLITRVLLALPDAEPAAELAAIEAEVLERRRREPAGRSAGCAFRNVSEMDPAGRLIDECGLRNFRIGRLKVAEEHANYVINEGGASEAEYVELLSAVRRAVAERHGFFLRPEVKFIDPQSAEKVLAAARPPRVNVLYGGTSSEREISLLSGSAVAGALRNAGLTVELTDVKECRLYPEMKAADVVYPVLHGGFGEDGRIQKVLEDNSLRFIGSGSAACLLTMDKIASKRLMDRFGLPTAKWGVVTAQKRQLPENLDYPVIMKAPMEGSTIGIKKVNSAAEWDDALGEELKFAPEILVEEYIEGVEITVPIVNGRILPAIEIKSPHGFYDYDAKYVYKDGHTEYFCPVRTLPPEVVKRASDDALALYLGAGCRDILRVDFIVGQDGVPYMLEGNSLPGCTATSLVPKASKVSGVSFERMTSTLVYAALKRPVPPRGAENTPAPRPARPDSAPNPVLVRICRWMFRIALVLCAVPILTAGIRSLLEGFPGAWILIVNGLFLLCAEFIFKWFNLLEKKKK
ncbi:MAG: D-alanine--D-alanine ligase [Lentisphaeria bacterium]|nr:D-alanine--D-alanine ligase [Lentisphaeria bacterium]